MGLCLRKPWRDIHDEDFDKIAAFLKEELRCHRDTALNIVLIGQTGAGKSSFINSIFSVSRGRITSKANVKSDDVDGIGTHYFSIVNAGSEDLFHNISVFDTMGFTSYNGEGDRGFTQDDLEAVCEGRVPTGHQFNKDTISREAITEHRPHCIIYVVSAVEMEHLKADSTVRQQLVNLYKIVPEDIAKIAVLTKVDKVCDKTQKDIRNIYKSKKVEVLVKKVHKLYGVQENEVFPVVNFVKDLVVENKKTVPLLYAFKFALDFAKDRKENREDEY